MLPTPCPLPGEGERIYFTVVAAKGGNHGKKSFIQ